MFRPDALELGGLHLLRQAGGEIIGKRLLSAA